MLIGLCGYSGAGKDTAASYMKGFTRIAFADAVKEALEILNPVMYNDGTLITCLSDLLVNNNWDQLKKSYQVRRLLQHMGTELGREFFDPDLWVKIAERKLEAVLKVGDAVFTDVRFPNEARLIRKFGGRLIWVDRLVDGKLMRPLNPHASENSIALDDCDGMVLNEGDESFKELIEISLLDWKEMLNFEAAELNQHQFSFPKPSLRPKDIEREMSRIVNIVNQNGNIQQPEVEYLLNRVKTLEQDLARSEACREESRKIFERMLGDQQG